MPRLNRPLRDNGSRAGSTKDSAQRSAVLGPDIITVTIIAWTLTLNAANLFALTGAAIMIENNSQSPRVNTLPRA
jgi:hypothetical protein